MRLWVICGILMFSGLFLSGVLSFNDDSSSISIRVVNEEPVEVVAKFVELSGHAKYDGVKVYTTHWPEIYLDIAGKQMMSFRETTTKEVAANTNSIPPGVVVMNRTDRTRFYGIETDAKLMNREEEFIAGLSRFGQTEVRLESGSKLAHGSPRNIRVSGISFFTRRKPAGRFS